MANTPIENGFKDFLTPSGTSSYYPVLWYTAAFVYSKIKAKPQYLPPLSKEAIRSVLTKTNTNRIGHCVLLTSVRKFMLDSLCKGSCPNINNLIVLTIAQIGELYPLRNKTTSNYVDTIKWAKFLLWSLLFINQQPQNKLSHFEAAYDAFLGATSTVDSVFLGTTLDLNVIDPSYRNVVWFILGGLPVSDVYPSVLDNLVFPELVNCSAPCQTWKAIDSHLSQAFGYPDYDGTGPVVDTQGLLFDEDDEIRNAVLQYAWLIKSGFIPEATYTAQPWYPTLCSLLKVYKAMCCGNIDINSLIEHFSMNCGTVPATDCVKNNLKFFVTLLFARSHFKDCFCSIYDKIASYTDPIAGVIANFRKYIDPISATEDDCASYSVSACEDTDKLQGYFLNMVLDVFCLLRNSCYVSLNYVKILCNFIGKLPASLNDGLDVGNGDLIFRGVGKTIRLLLCKYWTVLYINDINDCFSSMLDLLDCLKITHPREILTACSFNDIYYGQAKNQTSMVQKDLAALDEQILTINPTCSDKLKNICKTSYDPCVDTTVVDGLFDMYAKLNSGPFCRSATTVTSNNQPCPDFCPYFDMCDVSGDLPRFIGGQERRAQFGQSCLDINSYPTVDGCEDEEYSNIW